MASPVTTIPEISLAGDDRQVLQQFDDAYSMFGFAQVTDHGLPANLIDQAFAASRRFHGLPEHAKQDIAVNRYHRGYLAPETATDRASSIEVAQHPNVSESFIKLSPPPPAPGRQWPLHGPNQWPDLPGFREAVETFESACETLARRLIGLMARIIAPESDVLLAAFDQPTTWLRLLHYPRAGDDQASQQFGSAPHTDFGGITLLFQDDAGGLEVQGRDGEWIGVTPRADGIVVNTGDTIPVWSSGRWRSTPHRVVNPPNRDRYSIAYFFDPSMDTLISSLSEDPSGPSFCFGDHVMAQLDATYDYRDGLKPV